MAVVSRAFGSRSNSSSATPGLPLLGILALGVDDSDLVEMDSPDQPGTLRVAGIKWTSLIPPACTGSEVPVSTQDLFTPDSKKRGHSRSR
jgi:hypothetical protein